METLMREIFVGPVIESNYTPGEKRIRATSKTKIVCWGKKKSVFVVFLQSILRLRHPVSQQSLEIK